MEKNTWGIQFVKVDTVNNEFITPLALNLGSEEKAREIFNKIKIDYVENKGEPDYVVDLLDEEDSIVDDFALTESQVTSIAALLGHKMT